MNRSSHRFSTGQSSSSTNTSQQTEISREHPAGGILLESPSSAILTSLDRRTQTYQQNNYEAEQLAERRTTASNDSLIQSDGRERGNFQAARSVPPPTYDVPLHRQLATIQNEDQARLIRSLNLCRETDRYQTFNSDWPIDSAPHGRKMAASGWFYLGNLDRTQCFSCGGVLRNWIRLDNPTTEHISHFPHCAMAQGRKHRNIPDASRQALTTNRSGLNELTTQQISDLRIMFPCEFPVTPSMRSVRERVNTFNNWYFTRATPQMIAEAGLFALGVRDRVKCFYCNGGLQNWRENDNPWEEHAKWYPTCEFLLQQRGPEYIHTIVARFPNINRPILHAPGHDVPPASLVESGPEILSPPSTGRRSNAPSTTLTHDPLETAMELEEAAVVIGMGFDEPLVRDVMRANVEAHGVGYQTATALYDAVIEMQRIPDERENERTNRFQESNISGPSCNENMETEEQYIYGSVSEMQSAEFPECAVASVPKSLSSSIKTTEKPLAINSKSENDQTKHSAHSEHSENSKELAKKLRQTLQQLRDERLCKVCLDKNADMVFIPCGHISCCMECTKALRICPICRVKIEKAVRTYTS